MKKILITGASGFSGGYLCEYLLKQKDLEIHGTYNSEESYLSSSVKNKINFHQLNLLEADRVSDLLKEIKPDLVYHLAASSAPSESFKDPLKTLNTNINSEVNILESLRKNNLTSSRVLIASSCEVYGILKPVDIPVSEDAELRPATPYAVSKIAQDFLGLQYYFSYKIPCIRVRPFNHLGPRQSPRFVASDFSRQIAQIEKGQKEPVISVGNLSARRDFTDVRDIVKAYVFLMEKGLPGDVYNIGSGKSFSAGEMLDILLSFSKVKISVVIDQSKLRPSDIPDIVCDNRKLVALTGWKPEISLRETLSETLDYWRSII